MQFLISQGMLFSTEIRKGNKLLQAMQIHCIAFSLIVLTQKHNPMQNFLQNDQTSKQLAINSKSLSELKTLAESAENNFNEVNSVITKELNYAETPLARLFPNEKTKIIAEQRIKQVKSGLELQMVLYKLYFDFRLEAVKENFDALLKGLKSDLRMEIANHLGLRMTNLRLKIDSTIDELRDNNFRRRKDLEEQKQKYKGFVTDEDINKYARQIDISRDRTVSFLENLIVSLESVAEENLKLTMS